MIIREKMVDLINNTEEIIEREINAEELAEYESALAAVEAKATETAAKEAARAVLLDKLGITADEAKLLLG